MKYLLPLAAMTLATDLCADDTPPDVPCTREARASAVFHVENDEGESIEGLQGWWSEDGGPEETCWNDAGSVTCAWEIEGLLDIRLTAPGYRELSFQVDVPADECHVQTVVQTVTMEEQVFCTLEARPSAQLVVQDADGASIPDATASWSVDDDVSYDCFGFGGRPLICGWEIEGPMDIVVDAPGFFPRQVHVDVPADECHVITQQLEVQLTGR